MTRTAKTFVGRDDLIPPEAVEKLTFSSSLSIETTLSIEFRRKTAPCRHIFSSLV